MKILIDPQIFWLQQYGGISRYHTEVFRHLKHAKNVQVACPLTSTGNLHLRHYKLHPKLYAILSRIPGAKRFMGSDPSEISKKRVNKLLKNQKTDIFIPTYYSPYFLESLGSTRMVLTVYDMIHELFPEHFRNDPAVNNKGILIKKAERIIAISENTKKDIIRFYPEVDADKIDIVYLSHSMENRLQKQNLSKHENYLLFVGNRSQYKNFNFFIKAIPAWLIKNNMELYCLGGCSFSQEENDLIQSLGIASKTRQISFKDEELAAYYTNAFAFIFPSEYEGFGIPVLEAMACGCPVVLPDYSSFPEVAGNAGVYFKVNDKASLVTALTSLIEVPNLRHSKINEGYEQEKKFSWSKTVSKCLKIFEKVLS